MRKIFFVFIICLFASQINFGQDVVDFGEEIIESNEITLNWMPSYKDALKKSKKEKKPILIYFTGSDWCGPCKILDENLFHTEKFKAVADKDLVLLEVDIPRRLDIISADKMVENKSIQHKYKVKAFPTLMIVKHKGRKIAEKKGYILTE
jgi:thioredoxin-related protein